MKIKTDFTPAPWGAIKRNIGFSTADFILAPNSENDDSMHVEIGEQKYGYSTKESAANARLIATAPNMFQILIEICFPEKHSLNHTIERAKHIIESVTGKTIAQIMGELEKEKCNQKL